MQDDVRLEALKQLGFVLLNGSQFLLNDLIYERPLQRARILP